MLMMAALLLPSPSRAQLSRSIHAVNTQPGAAEGSLTHRGTNRPVAGADVRLLEIPRSVRSNEAGCFQLSDIPAGTYSMLITADGMVPTRVTDLIVKPGRVIALDRIAVTRAVNLDEVQRLDEIHVSATELRPATMEMVALSVFEIPSDGDRGYLSNWATSASRIRMPVKDITQVVTVFNHEFLEDMAPLDLTDILRYAPNVDVDDGLGERFDIRGNAISVPLLNGIRAPRKFPTDQADVERVELLSGPASVLYGNVLGLGGVVNRVTKRPRHKPQTSLSLRYADANRMVRSVLDTTGPLGESGRAAYRVFLVAEDGRFYKDHSYVRRYAIYPKFLFKLGRTTSVLVELDYTRARSSAGQQHGRNYDYILYRTAAGDLVTSPATGGARNTPVIIDVPDRANPEEDLVRGRLEHRSLMFTLTSELSAQWSLRLAGFYAQNNPVWAEPMVAATLSPDFTIARGRLRERDRKLGNHYLQADAAGHFEIGRALLNTVFGVEYSWDIPRNYFREMAPGTRLAPFDFMNPVYGTPRPDLPVYYWDDTRTYQWAAFGMAQLKLLDDRTVLNVGARILDYRQSSRSNETDGPVRLDGRTGIIPNAGILHRITPDIGVYYGYNEGYIPSTSPQKGGALLPPVKGRQHEIGAKLSLLGGRISATTAAYQLTRVNSTETHPVTFESVPSGASRSRGIEVTGIISATDYWQFVAGYSTTERIRTRSLNEDIIGQPTGNVLKEKYSVWTRYRFTNPPLKGLAVGFGINYQSPKPIRYESATLPAITLPGRTLFDALATYDIGRSLRLQVNVKNLTDRTFYTAGTVTRFSVGQPRTISFSATRKW
jgi:iron complex outermembrane recepter protein